MLLYGICETLFGNWSSLYLAGERGLSPEAASLALAAFWAFVTIGRIIVAVLPPAIPPTLVYVDPAGADRRGERRCAGAPATR